MIQEDKELLLKDLSARLPYGVKIDIPDLFLSTKTNVEVLNELFCGDDGEFRCNDSGMLIKYVKPYLFPLSSMTEEQRDELYKIGWYLDEDKIYSCFRNYDDSNYKTHIDSFELINWCYKNNFDINGLIPKGLANDATGLNIY